VPKVLGVPKVFRKHQYFNRLNYTKPFIDFNWHELCKDNKPESQIVYQTQTNFTLLLALSRDLVFETCFRLIQLKFLKNLPILHTFTFKLYNFILFGQTHHL